MKFLKMVLQATSWQQFIEANIKSTKPTQKSMGLLAIWKNSIDFILWKTHKILLPVLKYGYKFCTKPATFPKRT